MKALNFFNGDPRQTANLVLDNGDIIPFSMYYSTNQQGWFYSFQYGNFIAYGRRLVVSPNMLRQFRNTIPFGISCTSVDGYESIYQNDFQSGRINLYLLNQAEVLEAENLILTTIPAVSGQFLN